MTKILRHGNCHDHTQNSLYDGFGSPDMHVKRAKDLGHTGYAITDHGNISGWVETVLAGQKYDLPVMLGIEAYYQPHFDTKQERYHMTMHALDKTGYENIAQMMTWASKDCADIRYPVFTNEMLKKHSEGVAVLSGCIQGYVPKMIQTGRLKVANAAVQFFQQLFGDRYYAEVMPHPVIEDGDDLQYRVNSEILNFAEKYNILPIMTCDAHYASPEQYETYEKMWSLKPGSQGMIADYSNLYMHSAQEMVDAWQDQMGFDGAQYVEEAANLLARAKTDLEFGNMLPHLDWGMKSSSKLAQVAKEGLLAKGLWKEDYLAQMRHEMKVIKKLGFEDYFLMCWEMINWARSQDIMVGYGRGSVCGSLLAYAIGLTMVDPIRLGTSFDRFLHEEKRAIPDIDSDIRASRRGEVMQHVFDTYEGRCAAISTVGYYKSKKLVNDLCRAMGQDYISKDDAQELKRQLAVVDYEEHKFTLEELKQHARSGSFFREFDQKYPTFLEHFCLLNGQASYRGRHPAGVAITPYEIEKIVPLMAVKAKKAEDGEEDENIELVEVTMKNGKKKMVKKKRPILVTAFDMKALDNAKVLKLDILGLKTYDVIADVEAMTGCSFTYDILDDPKIYEGFCNLDTNGIFQFGSPTMKQLLIKVQPKNFGEVVACNTLVRPGASLGDYLKGKKGKGNKNSLTNKYCQDTYGALLYEEQKLAIALGLAKMNRTDADKLIKQAKKGLISPEIKKKFIDGAIGNAIDAGEAEKIVDTLALYSFNKGHCVGYSLLAVYTMWIKIYYPLEFYTCLLKYEKVKENREVFEQEAVKKGQIILLPHINGGANYRVTYIQNEPCIQRGLSTIDGIGKKCADIIERSRGDTMYKSMDDLVQKVRDLEKTTRNVHVGIQAKLEEAGAMIFDEEEHFNLSARYSKLLLKHAYKTVSEDEEYTWAR